MFDKFLALQANHTWDLVLPPPGANMVIEKWIFRHKFKPDGSLDRYKERWVLHGFSQQPGIDYDEIFSLVVKPATIRTVLSITLSHNWSMHQLDVNNAFLHGTLSEMVYYHQPSNFIDLSKPRHVCRLNKSLYGLKQAPCTWFIRFASHLFSLGFAVSKADPSLFILSQGSHTTYLKNLDPPL